MNFYTSILLVFAGQRCAPLRAAQSTSIGQPHQYGLMIECDGVLVDIHKDCHRVAFNMAFQVCLCLVQCKAAHSPCTPLLPICNMPAHSVLCSEYLVVHVCRSLALTALLGLQQFTMICSALEMAQQKA